MVANKPSLCKDVIMQISLICYNNSKNEKN